MLLLVLVGASAHAFFNLHTQGPVWLLPAGLVFLAFGIHWARSSEKVADDISQARDALGLDAQSPRMIALGGLAMAIFGTLAVWAGLAAVLL